MAKDKLIQEMYDESEWDDDNDFVKKSDRKDRKKRRKEKEQVLEDDG